MTSRPHPLPSVSVLIAAYDAGLHTSESYVARSLLARIGRETRVILITRRNNVAELLASPEFVATYPNVHLVGFDLPKWAAWWKKGPRGYGLYAYLWQVTWPFVVRKRHWLVQRLSVVHTLNFHNSSIPNTGWILRRPSIWGPINHNEGSARWRMHYWPAKLRWRNAIKAKLRALAWRLDPLLAMATLKTGIIFSAGSWVDRRLRLSGRRNIRRLSQLGLDPAILPAPVAPSPGGLRLVSGGRLDWIKGLDLALEALAQLPETATLTIIGDGPCRAFLADHASRLGVSQRVMFRPAVARDELLRLYHDFDLFVFPSAEAGGLAWVEALATGLPVVGFKGPTELSDMASHLNGIYVASTHGTREENITAFAQEIETATAKGDNPDVLAEGARTRYNWDNFAAEVAAAYQSVTSKSQ